MQDALLIYLIIANMRHAGYFRALAATFPWVTASSSHRAIGAPHWARRPGLSQALARLESYVATMA